MAELLAPAAANTFPKVISLAVQDSATAFLKTYGLAFVPDGRAEDVAPCAGILSSISYLGEPPWAFAMAFPEDTAVMLAQAFAGFEIPFDSPDMGDLLGEIANVVAGDISARLDAKGMKMQMSLPTVVRGDNVSLLVPSCVTTARLMFAGPKGKCWFNLVGTRTDGLTFRRPGGA